MPHGYVHPAGTTPDVPPYDELGTPAKFLEQCGCGVMFRVGGNHRCRLVGGWVSWDGHRLRQAYGSVP